MSDGEIFYACQDGHYVLKFMGDVRLTLCSTIDKHLEYFLAREDIQDTLVDLTETQNIDSTSLGLVAKLAIKCAERGMPKPTLVSTNPDITQILLAMGFDRVFLLLDFLPTSLKDLQEVPFVQESENEMRLRIIQAHKVLIDLNESNRSAFRDLIETLEKCT
ncbi:STAS domain-containing protein [Nitrincola tapanii]|uniref:Anti-sigma factor antagonist n=1 Tax=Nitrincola tapanii TaxID=1708751 RepID=A0A5A9W3K9_9GAMM|nr:STAS domain-containing protein [Nitrincola tapanii]KAA0875277.1 anti-sigma factor antagonist [Nitrincola tapanii]